MVPILQIALKWMKSHGKWEEKLSGDQVIKKNQSFSSSMVLDYSDFVANGKTYILEPITYFAPINKSRLSVSLLALQLCVQRDNRKKGIFIDGACYLWELQWPKKLTSKKSNVK